MVSALKASVAPRSRSATGLSKAGKGGKGKRKHANTVGAEIDGAAQTASETNKLQTANWGVLEPLRGPLSPVVEVFKPLWTGNVAVGIICILMFTLLFRSPAQPRAGNSYMLSGPERMAAYEEMWRKEESDLWGWLEERVGLDGLRFPVAEGVKEAGQSTIRQQRQQRLRAEKGYEEILREEKMTDGEMEDAIRVTQQRLDVLQSAVDKRKQHRRDSTERSHFRPVEEFY